MDDKRHRIAFESSGRPPANPPKSGFPEGLEIDMGAGAARTCVVDIPWPAECIGVWRVGCTECGLSIGLTAAGRIDDPRRLILPCGKDAHAIGTVDRRPWRRNPAGG